MNEDMLTLGQAFIQFQKENLALITKIREVMIAEYQADARIWLNFLIFTVAASVIFFFLYLITKKEPLGVTAIVVIIIGAFCLTGYLINIHPDTSVLVIIRDSLKIGKSL